MADKQTNRERLQEITAGIEQGIKELFESERYKQYLSVMSRFHRYSVNNTMLIFMQRPDATLVAGFNKWKNQFQRHVKKGERGITIIAPTPFRKMIEEMKRDPDTQAPILDADGKVVMEEREIVIPMFRPVKVFDVSQTDGKPLPELVSSLSGTVPHYEAFLEALRRSAPVPIEFEPMAANMDGYFSSEQQRIAIREGMSEVQTVSAAVHEVAHSKLHDPKKYDAEPTWKVVMVSEGGTRRDYRLDFATKAGAEQAAAEEGWCYVDEHQFEWRLEVEEDQTAVKQVTKNRKTKEVEAESISYAVCQYFGIQTGENSFGYIASWSQGKELKELRDSLETINKTSCELISDIERNYRAICKERGIDLTATQEPEQAPQQAAEEETLKEQVSEWTAKATTAQLPDAQEQALDEYPMPDPALTKDDLEKCGYLDGDLLPISKERAHELMERDLTVYIIQEGKNPEMAFDTTDLDAHDGIFALPCEEWEQCSEFHERVMDRQNRQLEREQAFLSHEGNCFAIYQVSQDDPQHVRFMNLDWLKSHNLAVERKNYDLIYTAPLNGTGNTMEHLEKLYEQFNLQKPVDFHSPSMSVSDIVAIKLNGSVSFHYCDSIGFTEVFGFLSDNPLKNAEMMLEDDYGMIDGIINNGPREATVSQPDQPKKSVLAQLRSQPETEQEKTAPQRAQKGRCDYGNLDL